MCLTADNMYTWFADYGVLTVVYDYLNLPWSSNELICDYLSYIIFSNQALF